MGWHQVKLVPSQMICQIQRILGKDLHRVVLRAVGTEGVAYAPVVKYADLRARERSGRVKVCVGGCVCVCGTRAK